MIKSKNLYRKMQSYCTVSLLDFQLMMLVIPLENYMCIHDDAKLHFALSVQLCKGLT